MPPYENYTLYRDISNFTTTTPWDSNVVYDAQKYEYFLSRFIAFSSLTYFSTSMFYRYAASWTEILHSEVEADDNENLIVIEVSVRADKEASVGDLLSLEMVIELGDTVAATKDVLLQVQALSNDNNPTSEYTEAMKVMDA